MWIFGYGSLVWKADFPYIKKVVGYVKGYERKFWQASIDHRGVPGKPGRVVTLVVSSDPEARVWGIAYKIHRRDVELVIRHLDMREVTGYEKVPAEFHPIPHHAMNLFDYEPSDSKADNGISISMSSSDVSSQFDGSQLLIENEDSVEQPSFRSESDDSGRSSITSDDVGGKSESDADQDQDQDQDLTSDDDEYDSNYENVKVGRPFKVTMYFGSETNEHYIGPASVKEMALQIFECTGNSGRNRDYLFNLAESMRQICDEALDSHLIELEREVRVLELAETTEKHVVAL